MGQGITHSGLLRTPGFPCEVYALQGAHGAVGFSGEIITIEATAFLFFNPYHKGTPFGRNAHGQGRAKSEKHEENVKGSNLYP